MGWDGIGGRVSRLTTGLTSLPLLLELLPFLLGLHFSQPGCRGSWVPQLYELLELNQLLLDVMPTV